MDFNIEHVAIWTQNLEALKRFYCDHFGAKAGDKYVNSQKHFESYFLQFSSGARLELMRKPGIKPCEQHRKGPKQGIAHMAFALNSKEKVDKKAKEFAEKSFPILDGPRTTGDGYYEFVIHDPDGNTVEIVYNPRQSKGK